MEESFSKSDRVFRRRVVLAVCDHSNWYSCFCSDVFPCSCVGGQIINNLKSNFLAVLYTLLWKHSSGRRLFSGARVHCQQPKWHKICRMAQPMQWVQVVLDYMKVKSIWGEYHSWYAKLNILKIWSGLQLLWAQVLCMCRSPVAEIWCNDVVRVPGTGT